MKLKRNPILIIVILLIFIALLVIVLKPKDCKADKICFNKNFEKCKSTKAMEIKDNNFYEYRIFGREGKECVFEVKLLRLEPGADVTVKYLLENKTMKCKVPINTFKTVSEIDNLVTFCSGELKEAVYTLLVKRMYGSIVRNLGQIVEETKKVVK